MGFLDKLKSIKNYITGGGAELFIKMDESYLRQAFKVSLEIQVKDVDINADQIYLEFKNVESVEVDVKVRDYSNEHSLGNRSKTVSKKHTIVEEKIVLDENVLLEFGESYLYEKEVTLPMEGLPTYIGKNCEIYWTVQAYIEKKGNDPNSKLVVFDPIYAIS